MRVLEQDLLRFITCGSVDDGKSTLIGRLLWESQLLFEDHLAGLERDSRKYGTQGEKLDFALLVDGLQAEREQGITIDVAYRFFATSRRKFIVADTPGHEQYTRNMATGASTAELAIILIDARKGVLTQTRRHTRIARMLGIREAVIAINKMDLVGWDAGRYLEIERHYLEFAKDFGFRRIQFMPMSALHGDNIVTLSSNTPWYGGPALLQFLEEIEIPARSGAQFRMPVQWVNRPSLDFRGFTGRVAAGEVRRGDRVRIVPSGVETRVAGVWLGGQELERASAGQSVTVTTADEVDVSRGDVLAAVAAPVEAADQFEARLLWMHPQPLVAGRVYTFKVHAQQAGGSVTEIKHRVDVNTGARLAAKSIGMNDIATVNVSLDRPVAFEPYDVNRTLGSFIVIDRMTKDTVGAGMIDFALRRSANIHWQHLEVGAAARAALLRQAPRCYWFTGLPGSGKSTIANLLDKRLYAAGLHTYVLDGDNVRHGLNRDLGFTEADRVENLRRVAEVARLMVDAGLIVLVSFISPYRAERGFARSLFRPEQFVEVFVDTPLELCEERDPKGLYAKARAGELKNFTGIDSPYEPPEQAEFVIRTGEVDAGQAAEWLAKHALNEAADRKS
jgi:bifunctional enzyme CysN/CysC